MEWRRSKSAYQLLGEWEMNRTGLFCFSSIYQNTAKPNWPIWVLEVRKTSVLSLPLWREKSRIKDCKQVLADFRHNSNHVTYHFYKILSQKTRGWVTNYDQNNHRWGRADSFSTTMYDGDLNWISVSRSVNMTLTTLNYISHQNMCL